MHTCFPVGASVLRITGFLPSWLLSTVETEEVGRAGQDVAEPGREHRLSLRASVLVWVCLSVAGWAALVGIGYSVYRVGGDIVAGWSSPDAGIAGPSEREIRDLQKVVPAAGGTNSGK